MGSGACRFRVVRHSRTVVGMHWWSLVLLSLVFLSVLSGLGSIARRYQTRGVDDHEVPRDRWPCSIWSSCRRPYTATSRQYARAFPDGVTARGSGQCERGPRPSWSEPVRRVAGWMRGHDTGGRRRWRSRGPRSPRGMSDLASLTRWLTHGASLKLGSRSRWVRVAFAGESPHLLC